MIQAVTCITELMAEDVSPIPGVFHTQHVIIKQRSMLLCFWHILGVIKMFIVYMFEEIPLLNKETTTVNGSLLFEEPSRDVLIPSCDTACEVNDID
jgi:hypothetical protein